MRTHRILCVLLAASPLAAIGCDGDRRLVEVYDNGPVGGQAVSNGYYMWVGEDDLPPPGNTWKPVDYGSLTPAERAKIRP